MGTQEAQRLCWWPSWTPELWEYPSAWVQETFWLRLKAGCCVPLSDPGAFTLLLCCVPQYPPPEQWGAVGTARCSMPALPSAVVVLSSSLCRLVYDRETGKPKGYGFCEYQDQETALSAMRNLNGREFSGRALRVDNAASEKNKEELKSESAFCGGDRTNVVLGPTFSALQSLPL